MPQKVTILVAGAIAAATAAGGQPFMNPAAVSDAPNPPQNMATAAPAIPPSQPSSASAASTGPSILTINPQNVTTAITTGQPLSQPTAAPTTLQTVTAAPTTAPAGARTGKAGNSTAGGASPHAVDKGLGWDSGNVWAPCCVM
ncbi:hypothetical protein MMC10_004299 [Thelotrema lepadinum]|nr:hypothetical protein [Thelotrema lepadinum]